MTRAPLRLAALGAAALLLALSGRGWAQAPAATEIEALLTEGVRLRKANDNAGALSYFQRAYQLAPGPRTAAHLGLCEMAVAQFVDAEVHLAEALRATADPFVRDNHATLYQAINHTKNYLGTLEIVGRPLGAEVEVDGRTVGRLPLPRPLRMVSGHEVYVRVSAPGHEPMRRAVRIDQRELTRVVIELEPGPSGAPPMAAATPPPPGAVPYPGAPGYAPAGYAQPGLDHNLLTSPQRAPAGSWLRPAGWISVGVAALLAGGGAFMLLRSNDRIREFNAVTNAPNSPDNRCNRSSPLAGGGPCQGLLDDGERDRRLAIGAFLGAGVATAAAIAFFASAPSEPSYALRCGPTAGGAGAACGWQF